MPVMEKSNNITCSEIAYLRGKLAKVACSCRTRLRIVPCSRARPRSSCTYMNMIKLYIASNSTRKNSVLVCSQWTKAWASFPLSPNIDFINYSPIIISNRIFIR